MSMRFWVYFTVSTVLFVCAVACSMATYSNYFSALLGLSDTLVTAGLVINFAFCLTTFWINAVITLFLDRLTAAEVQSIYQRGWLFLCNSLLYWGTMQSGLYMNPFNLGVCLLSILVIFVLHWVCHMRVKGLQAVADTQLTWRRIISISRLGTLCLALFASDILLCYTVMQSFRQHNYAVLLFGLFIVDQLEMSIVFCSEFAINVAALVYLHFNQDEDDWEPAKMLSSIFRLISSMVAMTGHGLFIFVFGFRMSDVGSAFGRFVRMTNHVRAATKVFTAVSEINEFTVPAAAVDLERDNTCVICREEMSIQMASNPKKSPRKLHCGHVMHSKCLTAWISQSATCPTCRQNVRSSAEAKSPTPPQAPIQQIIAQDQVIHQEHAARQGGLLAVEAPEDQVWVDAPLDFDQPAPPRDQSVALSEQVSHIPSETEVTSQTHSDSMSMQHRAESPGSLDEPTSSESAAASSDAQSNLYHTLTSVQEPRTRQLLFGDVVARNEIHISTEANSTSTSIDGVLASTLPRDGGVSGQSLSPQDSLPHSRDSSPINHIPVHPEISTQTARTQIVSSPPNSLSVPRSPIPHSSSSLAAMNTRASISSGSSPTPAQPIPWGSGLVRSTRSLPLHSFQLNEDEQPDHENAFQSLGQQSKSTSLNRMQSQSQCAAPDSLDSVTEADNYLRKTNPDLHRLITTVVDVHEQRRSADARPATLTLLDCFDGTANFSDLEQASRDRTQEIPVVLNGRPNRGIIGGRFGFELH